MNNTYTIILKNGKKFKASSEYSISENAFMNGVTLDYSCLSGRCSRCKTKLISGNTKILSEEHELTEDDIKNKYILTCCRSPLSDIVIDTEDFTDFNIPKKVFLPAKIDQIIQLTEDVSSFLIRIPPNKKFEFIPGQYINLHFKGIKRSYSISGFKEQSKKLELIIKNNINGKMSNYLFNEIKKDTLVRIEGPIGNAFLRNFEDKKKLILICTGTGIAPVKSIIKFQNLSFFKEINLFWGLKFKSELFWNPPKEINFYPCFSREEDKIYVQNSNEFNSLELNNYFIYACGSVNMIKDLKIKLKQIDFNFKYLITDEFVQSN